MITDTMRKVKGRVADSAIDRAHDAVRRFDAGDAEARRRIIARCSPPSVARLMRYYDAVDGGTTTRFDAEYIQRVGDRWKRDMLAHSHARVDDDDCEWDTIRMLCSRPWQRPSIALAIEAMVAINGEAEIRRVFASRLTVQVVLDITGHDRADSTLALLFRMGASAYVEDEATRRAMRALYGTDVHLTDERPNVNVVVF